MPTFSSIPLVHSSAPLLLPPPQKCLSSRKQPLAGLHWLPPLLCRSLTCRRLHLHGQALFVCSSAPLWGHVFFNCGDGICVAHRDGFLCLRGMVHIRRPPAVSILHFSPVDPICWSQHASKSRLFTLLHMQQHDDLSSASSFPPRPPWRSRDALRANCGRGILSTNKQHPCLTLSKWPVSAEQRPTSSISDPTVRRLPAIFDIAKIECSSKMRKYPHRRLR